MFRAVPKITALMAELGLTHFAFHVRASTCAFDENLGANSH